MTLTLEDHEKKQWWPVKSRPYNVFDFPIWIRWKTWPEIVEPRFFWTKEEMIDRCHQWKTATHWRYPDDDSGQYRVIQIVDRFIPQVLIMDRWEFFRERRNNGGGDYATLEDAKRAIAYAIDRANPEARIIHPYP